MAQKGCSMDSLKLVKPNTAWFKGLREKLNAQFVMTVISVCAAVWSARSAQVAIESGERTAATEAYSQKREEFRECILELHLVEQLALNQYGPMPCQNGDCLGSLSFQPQYIPQYECVTDNAISLFKDISKDVSAADRLALGNAAYVLGRMSEAQRFAGLATKISHSPDTGFRSMMLQAKCNFMQGDLTGGNRSIENALKLLDEKKDEFVDAEIAIKTVNANIVCAEMHLALGRESESVRCMEMAHAVLQQLPITGAVEVLREQVHRLMLVHVEQSERNTSETFAEAFTRAKKNWHDNYRPVEQTAIASDDSKSVLVDPKVKPATAVSPD